MSDSSSSEGLRMAATHREKIAQEHLEQVRPQSHDWLKWNDEEATDRIRTIARELGNYADHLSFDQLRDEVVSTLGLMTSVEATRWMRGSQSLPESLYSEKSFLDLKKNFDAVVSAAFTGFRQNEKMSEPGSDRFKAAIDKASWQAGVQLVERFHHPSDLHSQTTKRLIAWIDAISDEQIFDFFVHHREPEVPASVSASAQEWKDFFTCVFLLPNAAWMSGIFARTIAGQDMNPALPGIQSPIDKKNVGTYGKMITNLRAEGKQPLLDSLNYDKKEMRRWLTTFQTTLERINWSDRQ